jgi:hypothetical protein
MNHRTSLAVCLVLQMVSVSIANANSVISLPGGTVVPMAASNLFTAGPVTQAPGITWTGGYSNSVFGWTDSYGFGDSGYWTDTPMIGTNDQTSTMEYSFSTPINGVGGFLNYAQYGGVPYTGTPTISIFDSTHALLDTYVLTFLNNGEFHGFQEASDSISYFALSGAYIGLRNLTISGDPNGNGGGGVSSVPLPAALPLMASALGLFGLAGARRRKNNIT